MNTLFIHLIVSSMLAGLIWTIQIVHYPLFSYVDKAKYKEFQKKHMIYISFIVLPLMVIELAFAIILFFNTSFNYLRIIPLILISIIWLSTFLIQTPCHNKLEKGYDKEVHQVLLRSNWIRTLLWSCEVIVLSFLLI